MKKAIVSLALILTLGLGVSTCQAANIIEIEIHLIPGTDISSPNNVSFQQNLMGWLDAGNGLVPGQIHEINPTAVTLPNMLKIGDLLRTTPGFPLRQWVGYPNPTNSLTANEGGGRMFCSVKIKSGSPIINPRRVKVITWSSATDNVLSSTNILGVNGSNGIPITMSSTLVGRTYGADGLFGGADDIIFDKDTSDVSLNFLETVGPRISISVSNQADLVFAMGYWYSKRPIILHCRVEVYGTTGELLAANEVARNARPFLMIAKESNGTQVVTLESERPPSAYKLNRESDLASSLISWPAVGELQNWGTYINHLETVGTNYANFSAVEIDQAIALSATVNPKGITTVSENGNEVP